MSESPISALHFGGPGEPARALSRLLLRLVNESGPGDAIDWVTYYFRDRPLAQALMAAADRGVAVSLLVEGRPRRRDANRAVLDLLQRHGLGGGLRIVHAPRWLPKLHPHLHAKLYVFSGRRPLALFGSFNPSGDDPEEHPDVIREIGDHDRGHNLLVEVADPELVRALRTQVAFWRRRLGSPGLRLRLPQNRVLRSGALSIRFYPRLRTGAVEASLRGFARGDRISGALSHIKPGPFTRALGRAAARGAAVDLVVHDTERRVPEAMLHRLRSQGLRLRRYRHADGLPVHAKYLLLERGGSVHAWFGSFNFNGSSRLLNVELLADCGDPAVTAALQARFAALEREVESQQPGAGE